MRYPALPITPGIVTGLLLVLLPAQFRVRNIPGLTLIIIHFLLGVTNTVNAFVWTGNTSDVAPAWCDIGQSLLRAHSQSVANSIMQLPPFISAPHILDLVAACASLDILNG
jgi:hypothetical protein